MSRKTDAGMKSFFPIGQCD